MKVTLPNDRRDYVRVGDLIIGYDTPYLVVELKDGLYSMLILSSGRLIAYSYSTIEEMIDNFLIDYIHYPNEHLELIVKER